MPVKSLLDPIKRSALRMAAGVSGVAGTAKNVYDTATQKPAMQVADVKPVAQAPAAKTASQPAAVAYSTPKPSGGAYAVPVAQNAPMAGTNAPRQNSYDLKRQQIQEDARRQSEARKEALRQRLAGSGIQDSGIAMGQERTIETEDAMQAARSMRDIDVEELQAGERKDEAQKQRDWQADQNQQDRQIQRDSLAQAKDLAEKGLSLQQQQLELERLGMDREDARFYAGLGQARYLAERGLDQNAVQIELQRRGLDMQESQFYARQAFEREMVGSDREWRANTVVATEIINNLDPNSPDFQKDLQAIMGQLTSGNPDFGSLELKSLNKQKSEGGGDKKSIGEEIMDRLNPLNGGGIPGIPGPLGIPNIPGVPSIPGLPNIPGAPDIPGLPSLPKIPKVLNPMNWF